jgi:uncharacterized protein involved in outer membrane biogenesis
MRWKWIAGLFVILIIVLMTAIYVFLDGFDYNRLKPQIARMVKDTTGRELNLGGEVNLEIGFSPAMVVTDVTFANAPWSSQPQMIKVEKFEAQIRLLPLLFKHVALTRIGLVGVEVLLETDPSGKGNWDFIADHRSGKSAGAFTPAEIDIDNIRIRNLRLVYDPDKKGSTTQYTLASLDVVRKEAADRLAIDLKAAYNEHPVAFSGQTGSISDLLAHKRFPLELAGTFSKAEFEITGAIDDVLNLQGIDLKIHVSGADLATLGLDKNVSVPQTGVFGATGLLRGSKASLALKDISGNLSGGDVNFAFTGKVGNLIAFSDIDLTLNASGKDLAKMGPIIDQKLPTSDEFAVEGRLTGSAKTFSLKEALGSAKRGSLSVDLTGGIEALPALNGINLKVKASGKELAEIGPMVGVELPELGPFDMSGKLSGSAKAISLSEFSAMVDKSDFKGEAKVEVLKRPKITVRLESSVIDFTALMKSPEKDHKKTADKNKQKGRLFSDDVLPFDALKKVDADIQLKAKNIHAKHARLEFGHLTLVLEDGNLNIDKLEATYKGTKISGTFQLDPRSPPRVATNFLVQNFNLGDFLKETGKRDNARAIVDIAVHGKSRGDSLSSLMASLDGAFGAVMGPGYLTKYLDLLSMDLSQKVIPIWGRHKKADEINCAIVQFDIKEGVATSTAFVFDTQLGVLTAEGDINLGTERVNLLLDPKPKDFSLVNLSTKVRVTGTLMDPQVRPDTLAVAKKGAKIFGGLALGGPIGLLAPFVKLGALKKHPCQVKNLAEQGLHIPTNE